MPTEMQVGPNAKEPKIQNISIPNLGKKFLSNFRTTFLAVEVATAGHNCTIQLCIGNLNNSLNSFLRNRYMLGR